MLEVFNNLYMSIAEQMGAVLENTAASVTIKERLDFSCAVFDEVGDLIANAPHMPVHLGSMGASVKAIIEQNPTMFTASRGHHTDVGGLTPGSMPPDSRTIHDEGAYIDNFKIVDQGQFREEATRELLLSAKYPVRAVDINMADLKAQMASCEKGAHELRRMVSHFGLDVVQAYMRHVQDNAEECVRRAIEALSDAEYVYQMDPDFDGNARQICVKITVDKAARSAKIDFTGTTGQLATNYNAPEPVTRAAVLYVFRLLVEDGIPMNEGVMKPLEVILPQGTMLSPAYPAAVIAGNVETSQAVTSALLLALGVQAAAQSTMNNTTFGNATYQYYETICGGSGAGILNDGTLHPGTGGVHTHMTNSRLTDPEVLEWRFPVLLEEFSLPPGLNGGDPGALGRTRIIRGDGSVDELKSADQTEMARGDVYWLDTPSGGGVGRA